VSGLACSQELRQRGYEVLVVEARSRVGGRLKGEVYSNNSGGDVIMTRQHAVDVGGALIHGIDDNPMYDITTQMGVPVHPVSSYCLLMDENGWPFDPKEDEKMDNFFNECLDVTFAKAEQDRDSKESFGSLFENNGNNNSINNNNHNNNWENPLLKWHRANLELPTGASFYDLGNTWNEDEPFGFDGAHAAVECSWKLIMERLADGLEILNNSPVIDIQDPSSTVQVTLQNGVVLEADALVCTLPLGVLKLPHNEPGHVRFVPSLSPTKKNAIQELGCGLLNKCAISFPTAFWQDSDFLGKAEMEYSYLVLNAMKYTQKPILIFMYGGDFALDVEDWTDKEIISDCLDVLKKICGREIPALVDYCITRWGQEQYSRMAFTYIPPGVDGKKALGSISQPVHDPVLEEKPLIMFAGEHTTPYHPSTMHGAFLSGIREAYR
ncbi:amine oxidase, partial [Fragilariopsis cylindrus CCMP1102]